MPHELQPPKKPKRGGVIKFDEVSRAAATAGLIANRGNKSETASQTGMSRRTLSRISREQPDERLLRAAKRELAQNCAVIALKCGKLLASDEVLVRIAKSAQAYRLAVVMGISVDKLDALTTGPSNGAEGEALLDLLQELRRLRTQTAGRG